MVNSNSKLYSNAFTIVELLVVIVIIGILAAVTIVSYSGISNRAIGASLMSDLDGDSKMLKMYYAEYGYYPSTLDANKCPQTPKSDTRYCLKTGKDATLAYSGGNQLFTLTNTHTLTGLKFKISEDGAAPTVQIPITCPDGFIIVPGSPTYGKVNDFCVMKYEAKNVGGVATSQAALSPWGGISQTSAITTSAAACTGCHLTTEAEWMTLAQNVLSVPSNWSSGTVGTGYIYSGHNDSSPGNALVASSIDTEPYYLTEQNSGNQKRTLSLTNNETIWDLSGNIWEWTNGTSSSLIQPGISGVNYYPWVEWNAGSIIHGGLSPDPFPAMTGISGSTSWNSTNGIGMLGGDPGDATLRGFIRGGSWINNDGFAGVLALYIAHAPSRSDSYLGFRVAK